MHRMWVGRGGWKLWHDIDRLSLAVGDTFTQFIGLEATRLTVRRSIFRTTLVVDGRTRLKGLPRAAAPAVRAAIDEVIHRGRLGDQLPLAVSRRAAFLQLIDDHVRAQRWIPHDAAAAVLSGLPTRYILLAPLRPADQQALLPRLSIQEHETLAFLDEDHWARVAAANNEILRRELRDRKPFFDRIEKSPLTAEQASAVVSFDNRVRVIAAAGSGKTSVMVARAAYAITRGLVPAQRILMLAFNADAAEELRERVTTRLDALGISSDGVLASTFHSFGLSIIGQATGRKPRIAPWVENGKDVAKISEIVDALRDSSPGFRYKWDTFRLLYPHMADEPDGGEPDSYDRATRLTGFETYRGETVRSEGERLIANWLFLNGVEYEYEHRYAHDVTDSAHSQYRPDFFYPTVQVWHEHWALRADGTPPESFAGYAESMRWKKRIHERYGTTLVETTWHEIADLSGFEPLERDLRKHGLELDWNPDRPIPGAPPMEHERLSRLVRTFMSHVKSGSWTRADLDDRIRDLPKRRRARARHFLDLYWQIHDRWQAELRAIEAVDFDDMLLRAAELVEQNPHLKRWDLVMVDEFQDTSRARARLTKALIIGTEKHLLAVGDDWQAINRFAGADLAVMTDFDAYFGPALTRRLETTFRCTQTIADVASRFIARNPSQLRKAVRAARGTGGPPVTVVRLPSRESIPAAIAAHLSGLSESAPGSSVDVLGRYRFERDLLRRGSYPDLHLTFRTIHASKGLEADFVVLPNLTTGTFGFPSGIADDPILTLAMSGDDGFPHSEERRLFYVALTRARRGVTIFSVAGLESPFVVELLQDPDVVVTSPAADVHPVRVCPTCGEGTMVQRKSRHGLFLGCSRFPKCRATARL